jgi:hypothetical protein
MDRSWAGLLMPLLLTCSLAFAQEGKAVPVRWDWFVVSTPDLLGPFRGNAPNFKAPVPKQSLPTMLTLALEKEVLGQFEVIVTTDGATEFEKTLYISGPEIEKQARAALERWRFEPASLDGKPIRVRLRVSVSQGG